MCGGRLIAKQNDYAEMGEICKNSHFLSGITSVYIPIMKELNI